MLGTSWGEGKKKELNLTPIDEDEDLHEMRIHDNGHFPTIDHTLDEDDDDLGEEVKVETIYSSCYFMT